MSAAGDVRQATENGSWPAGAGPVLVCAQAASRVERQILKDWVAENAPPGAAAASTYVPYARGEDVGAISDALARWLEPDDDRTLLPVRVVWQPRDPSRLPHPLETLLTADSRHPRPGVQPLLRRVRGGRASVVAGAPARVADLRAAWRQRGDQGADTFAGFVARRLVLALERAESALLGPQHKVPRLVREEIATSPRFRDGVARLARRLGRDPAEVTAEATRCLDGLVAGYSRAQTDFTVFISRRIYGQGYEQGVDVVGEQVDRVREAMRAHPTVTLSSHRSYLDGMVLPVLSQELGLPRRHVLAGANMDFWPIGSIMRRAGGIFVRRDSKDAPVYRYALREYIVYLIEKRFHLEWFIEGGRSRTGKLRPPRLGALVYVVDGYRQGRAEDVLLVPVSIVYDQLREVADFAGEAAGRPKQAENAGWILRYWRGMQDRYGKIYVRFGEPVSLRGLLGPPGAGPADGGTDLGLAKVAFEVSWRINSVTPATGTALLTLTLLTAVDRALTLPQLTAALGVVLADAARHGLPMTDSARALSSPEGLATALANLIHFDVVTRFDGGPEPVYGIGAGQHVTAAFYRNSVVHFFLNQAITELALVRAGRPGVTDARAAFWDAAMALRDLLKFDFFFRDKDRFRADLSAEIARREPDWERALGDGPGAADAVLRRLGFPVAHATLRPFVEAYLVVATALAADTAPADRFDERAFLRTCAGTGRQMLLQKRIDRPEAVAAQLFGPALQLAGNRGLLADSADVPARRADLVTELTDVLRDLDAIERHARHDYLELLAAGPAGGA